VKSAVSVGKPKPNSISDPMMTLFGLVLFPNPVGTNPFAGSNQFWDREGNCKTPLTLVPIKFAHAGDAFAIHTADDFC
jgi:hypothetical protein